jgi:hypothetical protein
VGEVGDEGLEAEEADEVVGSMFWNSIGSARPMIQRTATSATGRGRGRGRGEQRRREKSKKKEERREKRGKDQV